MNYFQKKLLLPQNIGFDYQNFNEFLFKIGITRTDLVNLTGKSERSIQRYCNENRAPQWLYLVAYCAAGYLLSDAWSGWHIHPKTQGLINYSSPACKNFSISPGQINNWSMLYEQNRTLTLKLNDLVQENTLIRTNLMTVDHRRLVPNNVYPLKTTYKDIYKKMESTNA